MGKKLIEYYKKAEEIGGKTAQLRLGVLTCVPLVFAKDLEDTPETIVVFEKAIIEVEKIHTKSL